MPRAYLPLLLALLTMVGPLGIDAYLPAFLSIEASLNASSLAVQQTLSVYLVTMSVMVLSPVRLEYRQFDGGAGGAGGFRRGRHGGLAHHCAGFIQRC